MMRPIYLSKSSIESYISCEKKYYYRINFPEATEYTPQIAFGNAIHSLLESYWDNEELAKDNIDIVLKLNNLYSDYYYEKALYQINNYFSNFKNLVESDDLVEYKFEVPYNNNVFIVGKFDRVNLKSNMIIDWKTGKSKYGGGPNNLQSIIYYNSYKQLFNNTPTLVYVYLDDLKKKVYVPDQLYIDLLYKEVIPNMINDIRNNRFTPTGLFKYRECDYCPYMSMCHKDLGITRGGNNEQ